MEYPCPYCDFTFSSLEELNSHVLDHDITWAHFTERDNHQWAYDDPVLEARYAARKIDSAFEFSIRDKLTSDPQAEDKEVISFIKAVNTYRRNKGIADRQSKRQN